MANFHRFGGKVAVVAGGSYGIGYAVAERLAREGAKVVIGSRKKENVDEAIQKLTDQGYEAKGVVCHISNSEHRKDLLKAAQDFGGLDILFSNAGVNPSFEGVMDCPESVWDKIFDVNVKSTFLLSKEAVPQLKKSTAGRLIYISTIGCYNFYNNLGAYTVSKTALLSLTKMASIHLGKYNVTVNCVVPGVIDTRFSKILTPDKKKLDYFLGLTSLGRFGEPEEVAALVAFLASEEAGYITGENIAIAGGTQSRI